MSSALSLAQTLAVWALPVLFAITFHEVAHGWVARALGDRTAEMMGRLSLNPVKHIDPVGTLLVPAVLLGTAVLLGVNTLIFGWARPVPVVMRNLRRPRRDMALVAAAGPLVNLAMAFAWAVLLKLSLLVGSSEGVWLGVRNMALVGVFFNLILMVLNLLPFPPLDGSRVLNGFLPERWAMRVDRIEPYGLLIILALVVTGILGILIFPPTMAIESFLLGLVGLDHIAPFRS